MSKYKKITKEELEHFREEAIRVTTVKKHNSNLRFYDPSVKDSVLKHKKKGLIYIERVREFDDFLK